MTHIFEGFDIQPAIDARKVLMFEANTYEDCVKLVYRPTYLLVEELLSTNPSELLCLRGPVVFNKDQLGSYCDVDIVCLENKVVYLGTVRDWAQALANWSWFLKIYRDLPEKVDVLVRGVESASEKLEDWFAEKAKNGGAPTDLNPKVVKDEIKRVAVLRGQDQAIDAEARKMKPRKRG